MIFDDAAAAAITASAGFNVWWVVGTIGTALVTALCAIVMDRRRNRPEQTETTLPTGQRLDTTGVPEQIVEVISAQSKMLVDTLTAWREAEGRVDKLEARVSHLESENGQLAGEINELASDKETLLGDARVWRYWYDGSRDGEPPGPSPQTRAMIAAIEGAPNPPNST